MEETAQYGMAHIHIAQERLSQSISEPVAQVEPVRMTYLEKGQMAAPAELRRFKIRQTIRQAQQAEAAETGH